DVHCVQSVVEATMRSSTNVSLHKIAHCNSLRLGSVARRPVLLPPLEGCRPAGRVPTKPQHHNPLGRYRTSCAEKMLSPLSQVRLEPVVGSRVPLFGASA